MATKNLVPRENNEGNIGVSSRKWANAYFTNGNFDKVLTDELKNISGNDLLAAGDNITIEYSSDNKNYKISSTASGSSGVSNIWDLEEVKSSNPVTDLSANAKILIYKDTADNPTDGFYLEGINGDISLSNSGEALLTKNLFSSSRSTALIELTSAELHNDDRLLIYDYDADDDSNSSLKYIKKSEFLANLSVATKFVELTDTSTTWSNTNLVKAVVDSDNNLTFEPDTTAYLTSSTLNSAIPSDVLRDDDLPSDAGILTINASKVISSFTDNSSNWDDAHGWGDHSAAGYGQGDIKSDGTVSFTLSQDIQLNSITDQSYTIKNVPNPTELTAVANKAYVDSVATGLTLLQEVELATTISDGNITLSGQQTIDGISSGTNRILVKNQSDPKDNGIYLASTSGAWARAGDLNTGAQASGTYTFVNSGNTNNKKGFVCTSNSASDTVGTHDIEWAIFSSAGDFTNGVGLALSGSGSFSLDLNNGLTSIKLNDDGNAVVKKNDVLVIKDTSNSDSTNSITIESLLGDIVDSTSGLEIDTNTSTDASKIKIKDGGITLGVSDSNPGKIQTISKNKIIGYLYEGTDTSKNTGYVREIDVDISNDSSEWSNAATDLKLASQLSIKNYVDSKFDNIPKTSLGNPSDIFTGSPYVKVSKARNLSANHTVDLSSYNLNNLVGKIVKIELTEGNWRDTDHINIKLPKLFDKVNHKLTTESLININNSFEIEIDLSGVYEINGLVTPDSNDIWHLNVKKPIITVQNSDSDINSFSNWVKYREDLVTRTDIFGSPGNWKTRDQINENLRNNNILKNISWRFNDWEQKSSGGTLFSNNYQYPLNSDEDGRLPSDSRIYENANVSFKYKVTLKSNFSSSHNPPSGNNQWGNKPIGGYEYNLKIKEID